MNAIFHDWKSNMLWTAAILLLLWVFMGIVPGFFTILIASMLTLGIRWSIAQINIRNFKSKIDAEYKSIRSRIDK